MKQMLKIRRNQDGAALIEMAVALPVLVFLIYGLFEASLLLLAKAGMQHAVGEGARYATIYPTPTDTAVSNRVTNELFGMKGANTGYPQVSVTPGASGAQKWKTINVTFQKQVDFLFLASRNVTLSTEKRVYTAQ